MGTALGRRSVPSSAAVLEAEAERFLRGRGTLGATVWAVEAVNPSVSWVFYSTAANKARYIVVAGEGPSSWELLNEGSGWPVV